MLRVFHYRSRQIRTGIEQVVLDLPQHIRDLSVRVAQRQGGPDRGVGLVAIRVCHQSGVGFGDTGHIAQSRRSVIAGSGIDAGQVDCHEQTVLADWLGSLTRQNPFTTLTGWPSVSS
ncbi:Uncharacterised protein [Mycobacterium tuberculosis]|uniref:Uncharacterized protein n=1 Tax=Mycobacterium tuberculosis TaxID=1773 RepID=A0A0T7PRR4_MYCTX|nr:Uncharacterised protein [Mycobacterium tuberculosis]COW31044.1 Uncharacterised protein [Mycobacterium tuberculosis]COW48002.1 Uncharacterised protein [Mycobacterium tuberculosis]COX42200.1 Uncharacterised protein [Mycobacterium tuberculosis]